MVLTQKRITSAPRAAEGSVDASIFTCSWNETVSRKSPPARIASTCAGRAIRVTFTPARASIPPK